MKAIYLHTIGAIALTFAIAACVPAVEPAPAPAPPPAPVAVPVPPAPPPPVREPVYANFLDAPQTPGDWELARFASGSQALFNSGNPAAGFALTCLRADRRVTLSRPVDSTGQPMMRIRTETLVRELATGSAPGGTPGTVASLDPRDPLLDAMALSKGRFAVETEGMRTLYLPAWAEVSRVIEDCR